MLIVMRPFKKNNKISLHSIYVSGGVFFKCIDIEVFPKIVMEILFCFLFCFLH